MSEEEEKKNSQLGYDFFDGDDIPEEKPKEETPEEREDREIDELVVKSPRDHYRDRAIAIAAASLLAIAALVWWIFYHPVVTDAQATGRLMKTQCEGFVFKTYEGGMVSEQYITDTIKRQSDDFTFSVENDSLAYRLMHLQNQGKQIVLTYRQYIAPLPWRGKSNKIVTDMEVR